MPLDHSDARLAALTDRFQTTRANSMTLAGAFSHEDWMLQSMEDASPIKWNLAHTSWFFETFVLAIHKPGYKPFDAAYNYLFNSYYQQIGVMHPRAMRGALSRPSAAEIIAYRAHVDGAVIDLLDTAEARALDVIAPLVALGCVHEEQHQELMLTDVKHALSLNPVAPAIYDAGGPFSDTASATASETELPPARERAWKAFDGGVVEIGADTAAYAADPNARDFAFDNEGPRHAAFLSPFMLAARPVTNGEYKEFIDAGGYRTPSLWLADGWAMVEAGNWTAPLYWRERGDGLAEYTLSGEREIDWSAPVWHLSFYEAAAYAEFTGYRLPTEAEWEHASETVDERDGRFLSHAAPDGPRAAPATAAATGAGGETALRQMFGDVWEWTASPYVAYPGFRAPAGAIGEYNGKFMSSQMVLRGGSCFTPPGHARRTYRNFFPPSARWQAAGLRLARDS